MVAFLTSALVSSLRLRNSPITFGRRHINFRPLRNARQELLRATVCAKANTLEELTENTQERKPSKKLKQVSSAFTNLFPLWVAFASMVALYRPSYFSTLTSPTLIQSMLSLLMLSTGLTLSPPDILGALRKPRPVVYNFIVCYALLPLIALAISLAFSLEGKTRTGLLLLSIISGGQASNLCAHIAGGDTALSVTMTTMTTLAASIMLPLLSSILLGTTVGVDRVQLAITTARVTLLPILVGACTNQLFPKPISVIRPLLPVMGIIAVIILVLGPVAQSAPTFAASWNLLLAPVLLLHILGGVIGFLGPWLMNGGWKMSITVAFETAFKSPALSFVLAKRLFPPGVELASAISIVVLAPVAALFAIILRQMNLRKSRIPPDRQDSKNA